MNRLLKGWRNTKRGEQFDAHVVNYADDFVILSRGKAAEALNWTRQVATRMGVTLNEAKTCIKQARKESFNFLGSITPELVPRRRHGCSLANWPWQVAQ